MTTCLPRGCNRRRKQQRKCSSGLAWRDLFTQGMLQHLHGLYKLGPFLPHCRALLPEPAHEFHTARLLLRTELQGILCAHPRHSQSDAMLERQTGGHH